VLAAPPETAAAQTTSADVHAAAELLRALSAPHRLAIVLELAEGPRCVHELVTSLGISQSLTSQHLRVLRWCGLVDAVRRGKEMAYSLADAHVARIARDAVLHGSESRSTTTPRPTRANGALHREGAALKRRKGAR
jgi:ArsR family transcriptional regulator, zinc-responsive transcriptional repressor